MAFQYGLAPEQLAVRLVRTSSTLAMTAPKSEPPDNIDDIMTSITWHMRWDPMPPGSSIVQRFDKPPFVLEGALLWEVTDNIYLKPGGNQPVKFVSELTGEVFVKYVWLIICCFFVCVCKL